MSPVTYRPAGVSGKDGGWGGVPWEVGGHGDGGAVGQGCDVATASRVGLSMRLCHCTRYQPYHQQNHERSPPRTREARVIKVVNVGVEVAPAGHQVLHALVDEAVRAQHLQG